MANVTFNIWVVAAAVAGMAGLMAPAQADCLRVGHTVDANPPAVEHRELKAEDAVSMIDPAIDSMFARYADLHRDAVGYAMADLPGTSMVAGANPQGRNPITR